MKVKTIAFAFAAVALLLACSSVQVGYSFSGWYTDRLPDGSPVPSDYAQLELFDEDGQHLSSPLFESMKVRYSGGVLEETVLISGKCFMKLFGTMASTATFIVGYNAFPAKGDDAIPMKVAISTSSNIPDDRWFATIPNNGCVEVPAVDGSGRIIEPVINQSGSSDGFYLFIKTGSGSIRLTEKQEMSLTFNAAFDDGSSAIISPDNTISMGITDIITPDGDEGLVEGGTIEDGGTTHDTANIRYDEDSRGAIPEGGEWVSYTLTIKNGHPFCIKYELSKILATVKMEFKISFSDDSGPHTFKYTCKNATEYLGAPSGGSSTLNGYSKLSDLKNKGRWIGEGAIGDITLTISGELGRILVKNTANAMIIFK